MASKPDDFESFKIEMEKMAHNMRLEAANMRNNAQMMKTSMKSIKKEFKETLMNDFKKLSPDNKKRAKNIMSRLEINAKRGVKGAARTHPKFYPDDPNDCWDTGRITRRGSETTYNPIGNFKDRRGEGNFNWSALRKSREPEPERELIFSLENLGRRIRNMSGKLSIPVVPILIFMWLVDPLGWFEDDEDVKVVEEKSKPAFSEKAVEFKETAKEVTVDIEKWIKKAVPIAKKKFEEAKEELSAEPDAIPVADSSDPYAQTDDRYGSTESKY